MLHPAAELVDLVGRFGRPRIMLIGDIMLDEYIYGDAERLSPEAPVPVIQERYREQRPGGAGNVALGLATLGAEVVVVSVRGQDARGELLCRLFADAGCHTAGIIACADRPTTGKTRLVGLAQHRHPQQVLRLDQESTATLSVQVQAELLAYVKRELPTCAAVCLEDYNKGLLSADFAQAAIALARAAGKPVLVDPAFVSDYAKYRGAACITPNRYEAERGSGLKIEDTISGAPHLARTLLEQLDLECCVLTLDRHGMYRLEKGGAAALHPTKPRNVYDVTGAGDMVLATLAMAIAHGATWSQAVDLANVAGGLEVEKFGIVPIKKSEILVELLQADESGKHRSVEQLLQDVQRHRAAGRTIVFTNGVFDILHAGHVQYLNFSRKQGDVLIVGLNTDASVRRLKGPARPVNPLADRLEVIAGLAAVDYVVAFDTDTPEELIRAVQPDVLVKGADYAQGVVVGREIVEARGGKVVLAPLLEGRSTTRTIARMKGSGDRGQGSGEGRA